MRICIFLRHWHSLLSLKRQGPTTWHQDRLRAELKEVAQATGLWEKTSEQSDILFCLSRAKYDRFPIGPVPELTLHNAHIYAYMIGKFTLRWGFYRVVARICQFRGTAPAGMDIREVVNPSKDRKLRVVAERHGIEAGEFVKVGRWVRKVWPLLY